MSFSTAMSLLRPTAAITAAAAAAADPKQRSPVDEKQQTGAEQTLQHRAHLLQVEQEVRRVFDGLGSPGQMSTARNTAAGQRPADRLSLSSPHTAHAWRFVPRCDTALTDAPRLFLLRCVLCVQVSNEADRALASSLNASLMFGTRQAQRTLHNRSQRGARSTLRDHALC